MELWKMFKEYLVRTLQNTVISIPKIFTSTRHQEIEFCSFLTLKSCLHYAHFFVRHR